jgi:hypothetical protein
MTQIAFEPTGRGNFICKPEPGLYLSYNPDVHQEPIGVALDSMLDRMFGANKASTEETAMEVGGKWYILDGDFREAILKAYNAKGRAGVLRVFTKNWCGHKYSTGNKTDLLSQLAE